MTGCSPRTVPPHQHERLESEQRSLEADSESFHRSAQIMSPRHDAATRNEIELAIAAGRLSKHDRILDLCCGSGRHSLELAYRGFENIIGLDLSRTLINAARRRAKHEGTNIRFRKGDARIISEKPASADAVLMLGGSFGSFTEPGENLSVLLAVKRVLKARGVLVMDFTDNEWLHQNVDQRSWEWLDRNHFVCCERTLAADGVTLLTREIHVDRDRGVIADNAKGELSYSPATIIRRLADAGFANVSLCGAITEGGEYGSSMCNTAPRFLLSAYAPA